MSLIKTADDLIKKKRTAFRSAKNASSVYYDSASDNTELESNEPVWTYRRSGASNSSNNHEQTTEVNNYERSKGGPSTPMALKSSFTSINSGSKTGCGASQPVNNGSLFTCGLFSSRGSGKNSGSKQQEAIAAGNIKVADQYYLNQDYAQQQSIASSLKNKAANQHNSEAAFYSYLRNRDFKSEFIFVKFIFKNNKLLLVYIKLQRNNLLLFF